VPREAIAGEDGFILRTEKSVLFIIPWPTHWVIGTTDTPWDLAKDHPVATSADVEYLLEHANAVLQRPLTREDVLGVYTGLRPLLQPVGAEAGGTTRVSREHTVATVRPGLTVIAGGKYTTYRVMARDVVAMALADRAPGEDPDAPIPASLTEELPLVGADGYLVRWNRRAHLAAHHGWTETRVEHLLDRYGSLVDEVLGLVDGDPDLGRPLEGAPDYLRAEVVYAVTAEGALHLEDVLTRRTRLSYEQADRGTASARPAAELMAGLLGWDDERREREISTYLARVEAERAAEAMPDDTSAERARLQAPEITPFASAS
jgi:glycerol-3-phosphate dehydrogenase